VSAEAENGEAQPLIEPPEAVAYAWPQFMPDGRSVLFTIVSGTPETAEIALLDLQTMRWWFQHCNR